MTRHNFLLLCLLVVSFPLSAQLTLKEGSLKLRPNDTEILVNRPAGSKARELITDDNGQLCALIKITTENMTEADRNLFQSPKYREADRGTFVMKVETEHIGELWIFLSPDPSYLILKHPDYGNCRFDFSARGFSLQAGKVYEAVIVGDRKVYESILAKNAGNASKDEDKNQYLIIKATPQDASIYINGEFVGTGEVSKRLPLGMRHAYRVEAPMYQTADSTLEITERTTLPVNLKPSFGWLSVFSKPENGVSIYIDNELVGVTPFESEKRYAAGEHEIRLVKTGYKPQIQKVTVTEGVRMPVTIDMAAMFTQVTIKLADPEAVLYIDDQRKSSAEWSGRLTEGSHLIEARKPNHRTTKLEYRAKANTQDQIEIAAPKPIYGKLEVEGNPVNATVELDGKILGQSPDIFSDILTGNHTVKISKEGYVSKTETVIITEGQTLYLEAHLDMLREVYVDLTTTPSMKGLSVIIDGQSYGSSFHGNLNVGKRHVVLKYGAFSEEYDINVSADNHSYNLPLTGKILLNSTPEKATVYVDGEDKGQTPLVLRLPEGKYRVYMEKKDKDLLRNERVCTIKPGDHFDETFILKKHYAYSFIAYQASMMAPVGVSYGFCRNWGAYLKAQMNLNRYETNTSLSAESFIGLDKAYLGASRLSFTAGAMKRLNDWMYFSLGIGYGTYETYYQSDSYTFRALQLSGPQAELGLLLKWKFLTLSAGYGALVPMDFNMDNLFTDVHVGLGFVINHH